MLSDRARLFRTQLQQLHAELREKFLQPQRPQLAAVLARLAEISEQELLAWLAESELDLVLEGLALDERDLRPAECWEQLCVENLLPMEWAATPQRVFLHHELDELALTQEQLSTSRNSADRLLLNTVRGAGNQQFTVFSRKLQSTPTRVFDVLSIASAPRGIATAEALAKEYLARLREWGSMVFSDRTQWRVLSRNDWSTWSSAELDAFGVLPEPWNKLDVSSWLLSRESIEREFAEERNALRFLLRAPRWFGTGSVARPIEARLLFLLETTAAWSVLAELRETVPAFPGVPASIANRRFDEGPNPFEPAIRLLATGYCIEQCSNKGCTLLAPGI